MLNTLNPITESGPRKQKLVVKALTDLAKKLGPGSKLPAARELAKALGVTQVTLVRSLAHMEDRGLLHCRQGSGIYVEKAIAQRRVALVFGEDIFSPSGSQFGSLLLQHCSRRAKVGRERFSFFLDTPIFNGRVNGENVPAHQDLAEDLRDGKIDGVILVARYSNEQEEWLRAQGVPVIGTTEQGLQDSRRTNHVSFDSQKMINLGIERLSHAGCRTIGLIGVVTRDGKKFKKAILEAECTTESRWIVLPPEGEVFPVETHEQLGRELAAKWFTSCASTRRAQKLPDGLLITDDIMAKGILPALVRNGVVPGRDIKICSHANKGSFVLSEWGDAIFRVEFDPEQMAEAAFDMLEKLMDGKNQPSVSIPAVVPI